MLKTQRYGIKDIIPQVGVRSGSRLNNKVWTQYLQLVAEEQVDITVAGTAVRNRGSAWASFEEVAVNDGGKDIVLADGPTLRFISEMHAPSKLTPRRVAGAGVQAATIIREALRIHFSHPLSAFPAETLFRERDSDNIVEVQVKWNNAITALATGATGTVTNPKVTILQKADVLTAEKPAYIPFLRFVEKPVAAAGVLELELKSRYTIRAIVLKQFSDNGEDGAIITSLRLLSDVRDIIGPNFLSWRDLTLEQEFEYGGDVFSDGTGLGQNGYLGLNFQEGGRGSNVLDASREPNLRFELQVAPSGPNSRVRAYLLEWRRVPGLVRDQVPYPV